MSINPYAGALGTQDPMKVLARTPARLAAVARGMSAEQVDSPMGPGKWSVRQVMAHLADCEIAFGFRLRQAQAGVPIQPFDQDAWAESYARYSMAAALQCFGALRAWNVEFLKGLSEADKQKTATHPVHGEMTVWTIAEMLAGHDLHHLVKLEAEAARTIRAPR